MKVKALTTDGTWWSIYISPGATKEGVKQGWNLLKGRDLIKTMEEGTFIQRRNIVAIQIED